MVKGDKKAVQIKSQKKKRKKRMKRRKISEAPLPGVAKEDEVEQA